MDRVAGSSADESTRAIAELEMRSGDQSCSPQRPASSSLPEISSSSPSKGARRLDGSELCGGMDREPSCHQLGLSDMDNLQDSSEILAQWAQLLPDTTAFEQCLQFDDLDSLLENCAGVMDFPEQQPHFVCTPDSGTPEYSSGTMSQSVSIGDRDTRDDQTMATHTSSDSVGTSTRRSPGKRKSHERHVEAVADDFEPEPRPTHTMNAGLQGRHHKKRLSSTEKSDRLAIETTTDVDNVDDGYRWRKYGQKPVKNSDHPRNYFRCTTPNCPVRKQVERCTENPRNVLTTYDGKHNHPRNPSHSTRESIPQGNGDELHSSAPMRQPQHQHDAAPGLPPTNYMSHSLLDHMLTGALSDRTRWPKPPPPQAAPPSLSQRSLSLLRAQQLFMLQYQSQYPFLSSMLNLMQNYSLAQSPFMDPSLALLAAQNYGMRMRAHHHASSESSIRAAAAANAAFNQQQQAQAMRSTAPPLSRAQHRILRMQELMGEKRGSSQHPTSSQQPENLDLEES